MEGVGKINRQSDPVQRLGLSMYPLSIIAGKILGHVLGSSEPLDVCLVRGSSLNELVIFSIVLIPSLYFFTKLMAMISYGAHRADLKRNIEKLKAEN